MIGIVVPLALESRSLGSWAPTSLGVAALRGELMAVVSGVGSLRARQAATHLLERGARALVSWGTAGALDPDLAPGTLLLPGSIQGSELRPRALVAETAWRERILKCLGEGAQVCTASILETQIPVATRAAKRKLFEESGACAVDMESAAVASVAAAHDVPFLAIRAISDDADMTLPRMATCAIDAEGRLRPFRAFLALAKTPADIRSSLRLLLGFRAASRALREIASRAGPSLQAEIR